MSIIIDHYNLLYSLTGRRIVGFHWLKHHQHRLSSVHCRHYL